MIRKSEIFFYIEFLNEEKQMICDDSISVKFGLIYAKPSITFVSTTLSFDFEIYFPKKCLFN